MVSVICTAFNHERSIAQAMDSFLMQEADFGVEILIHDDASPDRTAAIIREYQERYPERIRTVLQTENQHSKGIKVGNFLRDIARGKYLATCEGDDYWTDPQKLLKQVTYMEAHPQASVCVHSAVKIDAAREKPMGFMRADTQSRTFGTEEIIERGGELFPTNSIMYRRATGLERPEFYQRAPVGDYPAMVFFSLIGDVYDMDEVMSAYRVNVRGSWTNRQFANTQRRRHFYKRMALMLDDIDRHTGYRYTESLDRARRQNRWRQLIEEGRIREARGEEFRALMENLPRQEKLRLFMKQWFPRLFDALVSLRRRLLRPER